MDFGFAGTRSSDLGAHYQQVYRIEACLKTELWPREYGSGVAWLVMGVNCVGPLGGGEHLWRDWETGIVSEKKYTKSRRLLEVTFQLNYGEVKSSTPDSEQMVSILKRGVMATYGVVKAMGIKDFDVDAFYRDVAALIDERGWIKNPEKYQNPPSRAEMLMQHPPAAKPEDLMPEEDFWSLIRESSEVTGDSVEGQIAYLEEHLATRSDKEMMGFELTLWELMKKSHHFNVLALLIAVNGAVTSPKQHIRFRCRLILYGRDVFYGAVEDPNNLSQIVDNNGAAERLLDVTDKAFLRMFGKQTDRKLPTEVAAPYIEHYHREVSPPPHGTSWFDRRTYMKRYRTLWGKYRKPSAAKKQASSESSTPESPLIPPELMMPEADFWNLIRQSIDASEGNIEKQLAYLEDNLATKSEKEIVGFELALRDLIRRSYHHNVVALLKVIEGTATDDPLLYFRCRLILYGQDVFHAALENPNNLTQRLDNDGVAELLLAVADRAFLKKFGENTDKDRPSDVGATYLDYNAEAYALLGRSWTDRSFAKRYAALLKLYE